MSGSQPWIQAVAAVCLSLLLFAPTVSASPQQTTDEQIDDGGELVRIIYVRGDVRFNRGGDKTPDLRKQWEAAASGMEISENYALATGNGRAQIEFQTGSVIYLAENSVLLFDTLEVIADTPRTAVQLVSGTATLAGRFVRDETFDLNTAAYSMHTSYGKAPFVRIDSFLDGLALTPQDKSSLFFDSTFGPTRPLTYGQSVISSFVDGMRGPTVITSGTPDDFDFWVAARQATREKELSEAVLASGLDTAIPGLIDLYESGIFSQCAPYETCWEPAPAPPQASDSTGSPIARMTTNAEAQMYTLVAQTARTSDIRFILLNTYPNT